jgi:hypothetical protein
VTEKSSQAGSFSLSSFAASGLLLAARPDGGADGPKNREQPLYPDRHHSPDRVVGLFLPPMGVGLLMALRFANLSVGQHFRTYVPYMLALFAGLLLIICIPETSLTLPRLAGLIR